MTKLCHSKLPHDVRLPVAVDISSIGSKPQVRRLLGYAPDYHDLFPSIGGFLFFGIGLGLSSVQTTATDFDEMFWPQLVRGCAIMFCILPPTQLALGQSSKRHLSKA